MSDIRITRGAGSSWGTKFGLGPQVPVDYSSNVPKDVNTVLQELGPSGIPSPPAPMQFTEISLNNVMPGDVLRYDNSKWRNYSEKNLTDGGNF